jgi:CBS domain containing-hemolysin-like protein
LPQRGEILHHPAGFDLEIVDADPRRVKRVRIRRSAETPRPPAEIVDGARVEAARARKA